MISIGQQIEEVQYELRMRSQVYARSNKMRQSEKDLHVARMDAVLKTLQWLAENQATIKDNMPGWVAR